MTTIILTIIGILLAAAAALMVIFYGGDAFNAGATGAAANTLQNAGTNVVSAINMYRVDNPSSNPSIGNLTANGKYLKELPNVPSTNGFNPVHRIRVVGTGNAARTIYEVTNVSGPVCARINKDLKNTTVPQDEILDTAVLNAPSTPRVACAQQNLAASGIFYIVV